MIRAHGLPARRRRAGAVSLALVAALGGCESVGQKADPLAADVVQETGLGDVILNSGDPRAAVTYFEGAVQREPGRADLLRSLAQAYARAGRLSDADSAYGALATRGGAEAADYVEKGIVAVRLGDWTRAGEAAALIPAEHESARRWLLAALLADNDRRWDAADEAYARAAAAATRPAPVLNNWGVSLMARGDRARAAETLAQAVAADPKMLAAKNNLAVVRALDGDYSLPQTPLTDEERAILSYNIGVVALRQGDQAAARRLFTAAAEAHPQHFRPAMEQLAALEG
jgi:Tfp pilus assembly protein PilF